MGIIQKQAIQNTIFSYLGALLGFLTAGLLLPNILTTEENGLLGVLISISTLFAHFSNLGINGVITRMFPYFRDPDNRHHGFLFYPVIVSLLGFALCTIVFFILEDKIIESNIERSKLLVDYLLLLLPLTFFTLFFNVLDAYARALHASVIGAFVKEVLQRIFILIIIGLYFFQLINFSWFVLLYVIAFCFPPLILAVYLLKKQELHIRPNRSFVSKPIAIEMVKVSIYSILTSVSFITISTIDKIMVNDMLGLSEAGIYNITFYFGAIIVIPARSILRISSTVLADAWKNNDIATVEKVYYKSCLNQLIIGSFLLIGIWANIDNIFELLPPAYRLGKYVILFIGLGNLIDMATGLNGAIIITSRYYRYDTIFMLVLVGGTILTNYLLIPVMGLTGSALASLITMFGFNLLRFLFLWSKFGMQPYDLRTVKVIIIGAVTYTTAYFLPYLDNFILDAIVRSTLITIVFGALILKLNISEEITNKADQVGARFGIGFLRKR